jgi:hypothetical protein
LHANARTCPKSRALIATRVLEEGWSLAAAAADPGPCVTPDGGCSFRRGRRLLDSPIGRSSDSLTLPAAEPTWRWGMSENRARELAADPDVSTDRDISSPARTAFEVVVVDEPRKRGPPQSFIEGCNVGLYRERPQRVCQST